MALALFYEIIPRSNVMNFNCSRMINFRPTITKVKSLNYRKLREKLNKLNKNTFQKYVLFFVYTFALQGIYILVTIIWDPLYSIK